MLFHSMLPGLALFATQVASLAIGDRSESNFTSEPDELVLDKRAGDGVITNCKQSNTFAMTFDDGPVAQGGAIAQYFNTKKSGKATFFVNGYNYGCIYDYADDLIARYKAGHMIASHSWSHPDIAQLNDAQLNKQLTLIETAFQKILGIKPRFFRPPYGSYNAANLKVLKSRGYRVVTWNVDSGDSLGKSPTDSIRKYRSLEKNFPKPYMALNHEPYDGTAYQVVPTVVPRLVAKGWKLVTVADCLGESPYQSTGTPGKRDSTWTCDGTPAPGET